MAYKKDMTNCKKERIVVVFIEGDTEEAFYQKLIQTIRAKSGGMLPCKVEVKNIKGVGQYKSKVSRIFEKTIKNTYKNCEFNVFLSYDTDVFELQKKPPVKWKEVINDLKRLGADSVEKIEARKSIEDWILYDLDGVRNYLHIPKKEKLNAVHGTSGLQQVFKRVNRTYVKGGNSSGLIESLNFDIILANICPEIKSLCNALGLQCDSENKLCNLISKNIK